MTVRRALAVGLVQGMAVVAALVWTVLILATRDAETPVNIFSPLVAPEFQSAPYWVMFSAPVFSVGFAACSLSIRKGKK
jgi:hypothetical protein